MKNVKLETKKGKQGFASMDKQKGRAIASLGGKAAQATGRAHRWNSKTGKLAVKVRETK